MPVQLARIQGDFDAFARIGATGAKGVTRLALTEADLAARTHFASICRAEGMNLYIDPFGNMAGLLEPWDRPAFLLGSHLDSVPMGGRFDGTAGVVAALEAVRSLREDGLLPEIPVGVVNFTAEESSRWGVATLGSKGMSGALPTERLMAMTDRDGTTFAHAASANAGFHLGNPTPFGPVAGFLELHVEQGLELETAGIPLGVVSRIAAPARWKLTVTGEAAHSGTTLMGRRRDALAAAAKLILGLEEIARSAGDQMVGTATLFRVTPASINVVPGEVELGIDIRSADSTLRAGVVNQFFDLVRRVERERGVIITEERLSVEEPVSMDARMVRLLIESCQSLGAPFMPMVSRAGHDAMNVARIAPTAMLFVPSRGGISHNPDEFTDLAEITLGARVLAEAVRRFRA